MLVVGLVEFGIVLLVEVQYKLFVFCDLLFKWNKIYNLIVLCDLEQVVFYYLFDLLVILLYVDIGLLFDVGSGGGLFGILLVIVCLELLVSMVDIVQKKVSFL